MIRRVCGKEHLPEVSRNTHIPILVQTNPYPLVPPTPILLTLQTPGKPAMRKENLKYYLMEQKGCAFQKGFPRDCSSHTMHLLGEETRLKGLSTWMCLATLQGPYLFQVNQDIVVAHFCPAHVA